MVLLCPEGLREEDLGEFSLLAALGVFKEGPPVFEGVGLGAVLFGRMRVGGCDGVLCFGHGDDGTRYILLYIVGVINGLIYMGRWGLRGGFSECTISSGTRREKGPLYHNILSCQLLRLLGLLRWDLFSQKCTFFRASGVLGK